MSQNANTTFEDVTIVHQGSVGRFSFISKLKQTLKALVQTVIPEFECENTTRKLVFDKEGRTIWNVGDDGWSDNDSIYSRPLTAKISYFQFKITNLKDTSGVLVGIEDRDTKEPMLRPPEVKMCNTENEKGNTTLNLYKSCKGVEGDVIGVVVDKKQNLVQFFINGDLVADAEIPKELKVMHAAVNLYYSGSVIETGDYISYYSLKRK
jgi:hypothetical protein